MNSTFRLDKWYLDVIDEKGRAAIGYWAEMKWLGLRFVYFGLLIRNRDGQVRSIQRFQRAPEPVHQQGQVRWKTAEIEGEWFTKASSTQLQLWEQGNVDVNWHVLSPMADAIVHLPGEEPIQGLGYAERLEMTVPPWKLPIRKLFWGRSLSPSHSLVWLMMEMQDKLIAHVLHDGQWVSTPFIETHQVEFGDFRLICCENHEIRSGQLKGTVLNLHRCLSWLLPATIRNLHERKWIGPSKLFQRDALHSTGWAIHEEVTWPC